MHRATLHDDIASLQVGNLVAVELKIALARKQDRIVERFGPVHEFRSTRNRGGELGGSDRGALSGADIIVASEKPFALCSVALCRIVDWHVVGCPNFTDSPELRGC